MGVSGLVVSPVRSVSPVSIELFKFPVDLFFDHGYLVLHTGKCNTRMDWSSALIIVTLRLLSSSCNQLCPFSSRLETSRCGAELMIRLLCLKARQQYQIIKSFRGTVWFGAIENLHKMFKGVG
jgi:hypothetical protein